MDNEERFNIEVGVDNTLLETSKAEAKQVLYNQARDIIDTTVDEYSKPSVYDMIKSTYDGGGVFDSLYGSLVLNGVRIDKVDRYYVFGERNLYVVDVVDNRISNIDIQ